jgi:hypothetical protein
MESLFVEVTLIVGDFHLLMVLLMSSGNKNCWSSVAPERNTSEFMLVGFFVFWCMASGTCVLAMLAGLSGIYKKISKRILLMRWYFCGNLML